MHIKLVQKCSINKHWLNKLTTLVFSSEDTEQFSSEEFVEPDEIFATEVVPDVVHT